MNTGQGIPARKLIPKALDKELESVPKYKVGVPTKNVRAIFDDSKERALYDEMFGSILSKPSSSDRVSEIRNRNIPSANNESKSDVSAVLIKRLENLEVEAKSLRSQLAKVSKHNEELSNENKVLNNRLKVYDINGDLLQECREMRDENDALKDELNAMHRFLEDYGLVWVGNDDKQEFEEQEGNDVDVVSNEVIAESKKLFDKLSNKVAELNARTRAEPAVVKVTDSVEGGGLKRGKLVFGGNDKETIKVTFYINGIMINRGPFRHRTNPSYASYCNDICDGYFPLEYKTSHPDGVLFDLIDRHDALYDNKKHHFDFNNQMEKPMSGAQLLNRIPKVVINNGNIVHMRDDLQNRLECKESSPTPSIGTSKSPIVIASHVNSNNSSNNSIATIQIRWSIPSENPSSSTNVFQIKLYGDDDISCLKSLFCKYLNEEEEENPTDSIYFPIIDYNQIEFRNTYPSKILGNTESLVSIGFVPNGIINAKLLLRK